MTVKKNGRPKIWDDEIIEKWADHLIKWADQDDAYQLINFCADNFGFKPQYFSEFSKTNQKFSDALCFVKSKIAKNRAELVINEVLPPAVFAKHQYFYDTLHHEGDRDEKEFDAALAVKHKSSTDKLIDSLLDLPDTSNLINKKTKS